MTMLAHRTVYEDASRIATSLSLGEELGALAGGGGFPLIEDPRASGRTAIVGMFVLRPARRAWTQPLLDDGRPTSMFDVEDWCFNVRGLDGGWLIAGGNPLDAYRLALQYGLADAVIVGSNTVAKEGVDHDGKPGYLWQPYEPAKWPQLRSLDPDIESKIHTLRRHWQSLGVLSLRRYPAQIVVSQSGEHRPPARDLFEARIFSAKHPDGSPVEVHVLTSETGAERMRERAARYGLERRIDSILLPLSPVGRPAELDIARVPDLLMSKLDVRIANHDGGATVLSKFSEAGVLAQINLTLMRGRSVFDALGASEQLDVAARDAALADFDSRRQLFFSGNHRLPAALVPASVITDGGDGVVATFDARALRGL